MEKLLLFLLLFITQNHLMAQCPEGAVSLRCQEDITNFIQNYPNCAEIESLTLLYCDESECDECLYSFAGLSQITKIKGNLDFVTLSDDNFTTLNGLDNLIEIGGSIHIPIGTSIKDFSGLGSLKKLGGIYCPYCGLETTNGFTNLEEITGSIFFGEESRLEKITGFGNLKTVGGSITFESGILNDNSLKELDSIGGNLSLSFNGSLTSINAFNKLESVNDIVIYGNQNLIEITGFQNLESIGENLSLRKNNSLINVNTFNKLETTKSIAIYDNENLIEIKGFQNLQSLNNLGISGNDSLKTIDGFNEIESIVDRINITNNPALLSLFEGANFEFSNVTESLSSFTLQISDNPQLIICNTGWVCASLQNFVDRTIVNNGAGCNSFSEILESCSSPAVNQCPKGDLFLRCKEDLTYFKQQYPNCTEIEGIQFRFCHEENCEDCTTNFEGLENIKTITGGIALDLGQLESFEGLNNVTEINGIIGGTLGAASSLINSFEGLENVKSLGGIFCYYCYVPSFNGFTNLEKITGGINFRPFSRIVDVSGFPNLKTVAGSILIPEATLSWGSFKNLEFVGETLDLTDLCMPNGVDNFNKLKSVGEIIISGGRCDDIENYTTISGFKNLETVENLSILYSKKLQSISGFDNLHSVENLTISNNDSLQYISGFSNVKAGITSLNINNNPKLSNCNIESVCNHLQYDREHIIENNREGCNSTKEILERCESDGNNSQCPEGPLRFICQEDITNFIQNYPNCSEVEGIGMFPCDFESCEECLHGLEGLDFITNVKGDVNVGLWPESSITNFTGLTNLTEIEGNITIFTSSPISNFVGLENLQKLGGIDCRYCSTKNFDGLTNVEEIYGSIIFNVGFQLSNVSGLENLKSIGGTISFGSGYLNSIDLPKLEYIGGIISLEQSGVSNLNGLSQLKSINGVHLIGNPNLSRCSIESICNFLQNNDDEIIRNNAEGCNSIAEILERCVPDKPETGSFNCD